MKKDYTRDYITEAYRLYAAMGQPKYDNVKRDIYNNALMDNSIDPAAAVARAEKAVETATPMLLDLLAVETAISLLERGGKSYIIKAIKAVYFVAPSSPLRKGDISNRVHRLSIDMPASERSIYQWLREARLLCASIRGLRIDNKHKYTSLQ